MKNTYVEIYRLRAFHVHLTKLQYTPLGTTKYEYEHSRQEGVSFKIPLHGWGKSFIYQLKIDLEVVSEDGILEKHNYMVKI